MRVPGSDESQGLHSGTHYSWIQIDWIGSHSWQELYDGFETAWMTCVTQSFQKKDHVFLVVISLTLVSHGQQRLVQTRGLVMSWIHKNVTL